MHVLVRTVGSTTTSTVVVCSSPLALIASRIRCTCRSARMSAVFPASESAQMVTVVRKNGTPVWWLLGKDEGHGFAKKKNRDYQFYATVMFVKEYLLK